MVLEVEDNQDEDAAEPSDTDSHGSSSDDEVPSDTIDPKVARKENQPSTSAGIRSSSNTSSMNKQSDNNHSSSFKVKNKTKSVTICEERSSNISASMDRCGDNDGANSSSSSDN